MKKIILKIVFAVAAVAIVPMSAAVNAQEPSAEDLAKAAQNPIASMISLPFQNNTNTNFGPEEKTQNILNIQPVWPFSVGENWNLITRTILPVMSQPALTPNGERTSGLGDISICTNRSLCFAFNWITKAKQPNECLQVLALLFG